MTPLFVNSVGLWSPGFASAEAWVTRRPDPSAISPAAALLPPGLRRRASALTRAGAEAFAQAGRAAQADLALIPSVWASSYGEIATTLELLQEMATEPSGLPSPTRFHGSVHNAAAGYVSIACGNRAFSTSLAAGPRSLTAGLLEAAALLFERGGEAMLVVLDEPPPAPLAPAEPYPLLAVAFHLSTEPRPASRARLARWHAGPSTARAPEPFAAHPCAAALLLADAVLSGAGGTVPLSLSGEGDWIAELEAV